MKKYFLLIIISSFLSTNVCGQLPPHEITRLRNKLSFTESDSARIILMIDLSNGYQFSNIDSALTFAETAIEQSRQVSQPVLEGRALSQKGNILLDIEILYYSFKKTNRT